MEIRNINTFVNNILQCAAIVCDVKGPEIQLLTVKL